MGALERALGAAPESRRQMVRSPSRGWNTLSDDVADRVRRFLHPLDRSLADVSRIERAAWRARAADASRRDPPPLVPPDPPHPLEAELRAMLGPDKEVLSVALRGRVALTSDGAVWRVNDEWTGAEQVPVPAGGAAGAPPARVTRMWATEVWTDDSLRDVQLALLLADGRLLVAGRLLHGGQQLELQPPQWPMWRKRHLQQPTFVQAALEGERVVDVFLTPGQGHVLTRSVAGPVGSIWVWGESHELALAYRAAAVGLLPISTPLRLAAMGRGTPEGTAAPPSFSGLSVDVHGEAVCAVDDAGALYAAGPATLDLVRRSCDGHLHATEYGQRLDGPFGWGWLVLMRPAPQRVLQVLAAVHGFDASPRVRYDEAAGTGDPHAWLSAPRRSADRPRLWPGDHLMALLADGTLWGITKQRPLPGATGVVHMRRRAGDGSAVRLLTWDGRDLPFRPAEAQMRARFSPSELVGTYCQGLYALDREGRVWRAGEEGPRRVPVPWPLAGASASPAAAARNDAPVDRVWVADDPSLDPHLAVRRCSDGALLLCCSGVFWQADLGPGQMAIQVSLTPRTRYHLTSGQVHVLTCQGSIWAWAAGDGALLGVGTVGKLSKPVQMLQAVSATERKPLILISELSVDPSGRVLCAASQQSRSLYACGPMFRFIAGSGDPWPAPMRLHSTRSKVLQVLAAHADALHILTSDGNRTWEIFESGLGDGVLALCANGTVWGLARQGALPGVAGVRGLRRDGHTVRMIMEDGREETLPG